MSLIVGIGDEVVNFFIIIGVLILSWLAWRSTNIRGQPLVRTILILQRRNRTSVDHTRENEPIMQNNNIVNQNVENNSSQTSTNNNPDVNVASSGANTPTTSSSNEQDIIQAMDSSSSSAKLSQENNAEDKQENVKDETKSEDSSASSSNQEHPEKSSVGEDTENISIKLKFINDDERLVTASLQELLGDFKRRNFQVELNSQKLVRLVFKGKIVQPDDLTLKRCGFYNNCVVHCLIHQVNNRTQSTSNNTTRFYVSPMSFQNIPGGNVPDARVNSNENDWDLSYLLLCVVTLILSAAWYFRYHNAQLFNTTATTGLLGLTAIFTVTLFGHLFPELQNNREL